MTSPRSASRLSGVQLRADVRLRGSRRFALAALVAALLASGGNGGGAGGGAVAVAAPAERRRVDARTGMLEVPIEELMAAVRRKDRAEIGRIAEQVGPARLVQSLRRSETPVLLAALAGVAELPGRARLVGPVTELVVTAEPPVAAAAARTLGEILGPVTVAELDDWEIPPDAVEAACVVLRSAAIAPHSATTLRLAALDALGDAATMCPPTPELLGLLRDPTPAVRRAAALMLRPQQRLATGGFASGTRDVDKSVAAASVAALCEVWALRGGAAARKEAREPIWEPTRQAARRLAGATDTAAEDAVQMLDCLDPTLASDRQLLDGLRGRRRSPVSERAAELLGQTQSRTRP